MITAIVKKFITTAITNRTINTIVIVLSSSQSPVASGGDSLVAATTVCMN